VIESLDRPWLRKYPTSVPAHLEIPSCLLPQLIEPNVGRWGSRAALVFQGARWSYRRFWEQSGHLAAALLREGVGPGDRVAIYLPNGPAFPIAFFAILRVGAIVVPVSPLYHDVDLLAVLGDAQPSAIVTLESQYPRLEEVSDRFRLPVTFVARLREFYPVWTRPFVNRSLRGQHLSTRFPASANVRPWKSAVRAPGSVPPVSADPATQVAVLQYTGGTTGTPKGAMLTHRNLVANVTQVDAWNTTRVPGSEVVLAAIPFSHIYGLTVALLVGLSEGATVVMMPRPDPHEILRLIRRYRPTQFPGVPALYQALLRQPDLANYPLRSIRFCLSGSAPLPPDVQRRFEEVTGAALREGYGLTETSPVTHINPVEGERRSGSIGLPLPETDQRAVDLDDPTRVLPVGSEGELAVRGPQVMLGYYRRPEETGRSVRDGWFLTGDVVRIDADGYAYLVDRKKDIVNVGGLKVYPREVEEVLLHHPGVMEAAVVSVPDPDRGEAPKAFVVRTPGSAVSEAELIEFVRARLAHYKAPRRVEFRDALPRSGVQKVLRRVLRADPGPVSATVAGADRAAEGK
jgi:long-chain acyl-CoA synthetase